MKRFIVLSLVVCMLAVCSSAWASNITVNGNVPNGTVGKSYRATFNVQFSTSANLTWSHTGNVSDLTFSGFGASASLTGTPTIAGLRTITVTCRNGAGESSTKTFNFTIASASGGDDSSRDDETSNLSIGGYLNAKKVGTKYPENLYGELIGKATASGGTPPYTWSVIENLPKGLTLGCSPTGLGYKENTFVGPYTVLCGIPELGGTYIIMLKVTDSKGKTAYKSFTVTITGGDINEIKTKTVGSFSGQDARKNFPYGVFTDQYVGSVYVESGGRAPYTWSVGAGKIPAGFKLKTDNNGKRCEMSGKPNGNGTFKFKLKVTDVDGRIGYTEEYSITFSGGSNNDPDANGDETLPDDDNPKPSNSGIAINSTNFTDAAFRSYVSANFDADKNGYLSASEISSAKRISLWHGYNSTKIKSLKGIEYFTALTYLDCDDNQLTALDLSKNTALMNLYCSSNQIAALDVSKNTALTTLWCYSNKLTSLKLGNNSKLTSLKCKNNNLTSVDTSGCPNLTTFEHDTFGGTVSSVEINMTNFPDAAFRSYVSSKLDTDKNGYLSASEISSAKSIYINNGYNGSKVKSLKGIEYFTALTSLYCSSNQLTTLDVSKNTALKLLYCSSNQLTSLSLGSNSNLDSLMCENNKLTSVDTSGCPNLKRFEHDTFVETVSTVGIDIMNFPDSYFRMYVREKFDTDGNSILSVPEILSAKKIDMRSSKLKSLKGIEYLIALTYLDCDDNQLTALDLSKNTALKTLICSGNSLRTLDVSKNTALESLNCEGNQLTALDVSKNTVLTALYCDYNQLTALNVSKNTALESLSFYNNKLTTLDVSKNTALKTLECSANKLTTLDVSKNTALESLECHLNQLIALNVSKNTALTELGCCTNKLTSLKLGNNTSLTILTCYSNTLTTLDVSKNTALKTLNCAFNQLTALNVNKNAALETLECENNRLTALDVSKNTALKTLSFYSNKLTTLDVSKNTALKTLECENNRLTALNVNKNTALTYLSCYNNKLTTLDVSKNTALSTLYCYDNKLTSLKLGNNSKLTTVKCKNNKLTSIDASGCPNLKTFEHDSNVTTLRAKPIFATAPQLPDGTLKEKYSLIQSIAGTAPISLTYSGTVPPGLTLYDRKANGYFDFTSKTLQPYETIGWKLEGTPTKAGTYSFTLKATNSAGSVSRTFTITITQPTIAATFANGVIKAAYSSAVTVSGGTANYTWKNSGTIPTGLKLTYSGAKATLSGTPTKAGTYTFTLTATDKNKAAVTKSFTVKITQPAIAATFANGVIKAAYSSAVTVSGGTAAYTWKNSGTIPTGLKLTYSGAKATLSGTPTKAGTYTFTLTATDKNKAAVTKSFAVKITQPAIAATFANGVIKAAYTSSVTVSGGTANYTWKNTGTLPTGLKITYSGAKATLSGTPTKAGTYTFTLTATDKNKAAVTKSFTVKITQPTIAATFANGVIKAAYTSSVTVSGGTANYTWKNTGTLPTGLKITYSGAKATLSGTPTKAGTYTFTLTATDKNKAAVTKSFTVKITQPTIAATFANGVIKAAYTSAVTVSGGTAAYTWKNSGTIPTGLKLTYSGAKATLSGTPTKAGTYTFTLTATDKNKAAVTKSFTVKITQPAIAATFANGVIKAAYSSSVTVSGGTANYTWKNTGTLPTGLKITYSGAKATLSGTPTKAGTYTFTLTATDKNKAAVTKSFTVKITQPAIAATFANGVIKAAYTSSVTVSGGTANYTWKNTGTLPTGLKITYSGAKATLSGTPTKAGTYTFTLTATDKNKAAVTKSFTVKITQPTIAATFANGVIKAAYSSAVKVSGGTAAYTWKNSGTIPTGLKITYSCAKATLSGTPTKAGTYTFTLTATDKNKAAISKSFTVKITEAKATNKALPESSKVSPNAETLTGNTQTAAESKSSLPSAKTALSEEQPEISGNGTTNITLSATLNVMSDDIAEAFDERDSDIVKVRENMPARFISNWGAKVSEIVVYVDDNPVNDITVSREGLFTLPAEIVSGDFKVSVKAQSEAGEIESNELYIIAE